MANFPNTKLHLESIDRIGSIPLIESSIKNVETFYGRIKNSNRLFNWYFETAEATLYSVYETVQPAVNLFETPIKRLDNVVCKSLELLEQQIPMAYLPPEMMYWNTKSYMSNHLVKPVLKRADSVKQIGTAVLESPITTYAANRLDGALTAGDRFVDKYLIPIEGDQDQTDAPNDEDNNVTSENEKGAIKAIHHGQRFSRKLKRRLTQRTLAEARALKKQSREAIHVLIYAAEMIAKDPKQAMQKAKEIWLNLSKDEPENQARPATLEQLIVLLTRESARCVVHFVNFGCSAATTIPKTVSHAAVEVYHHMVYYNNRLISITRLDKVKKLSEEEAMALVKRMAAFYDQLQHLSNGYLERLASFLSGRIEAEKISGQRNTGNSNTETSAPSFATHSSNPRRRNHIQENNEPSHINGVY